MPATSPISKETAQSIVASISSLPHVRGMHAGRFGEVALLFPGERVKGLLLIDGRLETHIVASMDGLPDLKELANAVRAIVEQQVDVPVDVIIGDVA